MRMRFLSRLKISYPGKSGCSRCIEIMALVEVFSLSHLRRAFYKGARARAQCVNAPLRSLSGRSIGLTVISDIVFIHCVSHTFIRQQCISRSLLKGEGRLSRRDQGTRPRLGIKALRSPTMFRIYAFPLESDRFFRWIRIQIRLRVQRN